MAVTDETIRLAKAMRITIDAEVDARVRELVRAWARAWDEIRTVWADALMDLAQAGQDGQWPDPWTVARAEKAQAALAAATDEIRELANLTGVTITDGTGRVVDATPALHADVAISQLPTTVDRADAVVRFGRFDEIQMREIVRRTAGQITAATWRLELAATEAMRRTLVNGIVVGDNPRRAAREMLRRVEGAFNGGLTRALTIARTEMLDAHRAAGRSWELYNDDLVTGWQWIATLDTHTCPSCWGMHGTTWDPAVSGPDDHQQGRCARLPLTRPWRDLGFDLDEPPSVVPDAEEVFAGMSRADQLAVMGPARLDALGRGAVTLGDLARRRSTVGWRDSWAPTPVRDLPAA